MDKQLKWNKNHTMDSVDLELDNDFELAFAIFEKLKLIFRWQYLLYMTLKLFQFLDNNDLPLCLPRLQI